MISYKVARAVARTFGVRSLLAAPDANPKLAKSRKIRVLTAPLHLAPARSSGVMNVCAYAGACEDPCIDGTGNPLYTDAKHAARVARTKMFKYARDAYMVLLVCETAAHVARARRKRMRAAVRPNATSDLRYESFPVTITAETAAHIKRHYGRTIKPGTYPNVMACFPRVRWYDYTKLPARIRAADLPANYSLTYSYDPKNKVEDLRDAIERGWNVAAPFMVKRGKALPAAYELAGKTLRVIDGDTHDYRPADESGVIVGLRFKVVTDPARVAKIGKRAARTGEGFALPV